MSNSNPVSRRQFVKSSVTAAGLAALAATGSACPVSYDGSQGDWWCVYDIDSSDPQIWIYFWKNCSNGSTMTTMGPPGIPTGKCSNAPNEIGCVKSEVIFDWEQVTVGKMAYRISPDLDAKTRAAGIRLVTSRTKGS